MDSLLHGFLVTTILEHRRTKVRGDDLSIVSQVTGKKARVRSAVPMADIEEPRAGPYATDGDCLLAPVAAQAKAQHGVEDNIIVLGNCGNICRTASPIACLSSLTSDIFMDDEPPDYGQSQEPSATPL